MTVSSLQTPEPVPLSSADRVASARAPENHVVIIGGGPGGYEAALVAAQLGAHQVTLVERAGLGGSAVLTDVVPSKTLIATAEVMTLVDEAHELGVVFPGADEDLVPGDTLHVNLERLNARVRALAHAQSQDVLQRLRGEGVHAIKGTGKLLDSSTVQVTDANGVISVLHADVVLLAVGTRPRMLPDAMPDGERILTWTQLYNLTELPERLIVVGSGVTGAEFANAYDALGSEVTLVSSRDQVLPGEDEDAAAVIEDVFKRRGMTVLSKSRASKVVRTGSGVQVTLEDGRIVLGSHCLMAVGSIPNTDNLGLEEVGVATTPSGHIDVDRVSRSTRRGIYAAGDCTGVLPLASVAAMQGRIAMWHALGDAVAPLNLETVSANIFTAPEIATVGVTEEQITAGTVGGQIVRLPLAGNARAKMQGISDGFIKLFSATNGTVLGGVVVSPRASELIYPITVAVQNRLTVDQLATSFTVYPSLTGSLAEAARQLHVTAPS